MAPFPSEGQAQPPRKKTGLPVWLVVAGALAIVGCLVAFVVIVIGFYALASDGHLKKETERHRDGGREFGKTHEQRDCVRDVMARLDTSDIFQQIHEGQFLVACLEVAKPTEGFCQGVPKESEILSTVTWRLEACRQLGKPNNDDCSRMMGRVQNFCHPKAAASGSVDSSNLSR